MSLFLASIFLEGRSDLCEWYEEFHKVNCAVKEKSQPSTKEAEEGDPKFQANLDHVTRPSLRLISKKTK